MEDSESEISVHFHQGKSERYFTFVGSDEELKIIDEVAQTIGISSNPSAGKRKIVVEETEYGPNELGHKINILSKVKIVPMGMLVGLGRSY